MNFCVNNQLHINKLSQFAVTGVYAVNSTFFNYGHIKTFVHPTSVDAGFLVLSSFAYPGIPGKKIAPIPGFPGKCNFFYKTARIQYIT